MIKIMLLLLTWWLRHITVETKIEKYFIFFFVDRESCALENILAASELLYKWVQISQICLNVISDSDLAKMLNCQYLFFFILHYNFCFKSFQNTKTLFPGFSV